MFSVIFSVFPPDHVSSDSLWLVHYTDVSSVFFSIFLPYGECSIHLRLGHYKDVPSLSFQRFFLPDHTSSGNLWLRH